MRITDHMYFEQVCEDDISSVLLGWVGGGGIHHSLEKREELNLRFGLKCRNDLAQLVPCKQALC